MQLIQLLLLHGGGRVSLRETLGVEQKQQRKGSYRGLFLLQCCNSNMQLIQLLLPVPAK